MVRFFLAALSAICLIGGFDVLVIQSQQMGGVVAQLSSHDGQYFSQDAKVARVVSDASSSGRFRSGIIFISCSALLFVVALQKRK